MRQGIQLRDCLITEQDAVFHMNRGTGACQAHVASFGPWLSAKQAGYRVTMGDTQRDDDILYIHFIADLQNVVNL